MAHEQPRNVAAVMHGINDLRVQEWPLPEAPPPGCVRVAIKRVGICGSDVHFLQHGRIGDFVVRSPMVIGHESAGVVTQLGPPRPGTSGSSSWAGLAVGDAVALEPGVPCWHCKASREGRYNLDPDISFFATPPVHGSLARFVDHPAELCYKLPPGLSLDEGAMCEPLSVGVHACRRAGVQPGKSVAVLGAGPIGLIVAMTAAAFGADSLVITGIRQSCLDFATSHCSGAVPLLVQPGQSAAQVADSLRAAMAAGQACSGGSSSSSSAGAPDIIIDCVGVQQSLEAAVRAVAAGGRVVLVGMRAEELSLPAILLTCKEVDLLGSFRYANTYPLCLSLLASRRVNVTPLITHRFSFTPGGVAAGFDTAARASETAAIKVMFDCGEDDDE